VPPRPLSFTWLGHSTFLFRTPDRKRILLDPWLVDNPSSPGSAREIVGTPDLILVTHGHSDHVRDVVPIARSSGADVIAPFELSEWLGAKGLRRTIGMNPGGTLTVAGVSVTMVPAVHSSSVEEEGRRVYAGAAVGYVMRFENGIAIYFAGDTALFGDMRLIGELYRPLIGFLPIGDVFTMGPEQAARACELVGIRQVVPMHYGTFPALTGTPARLKALVEPLGITVLELQPGESASVGP